MGVHKKYINDEDRRKAKLEAQKKWREKNRDYHKEWYSKNKKRKKKYPSNDTKYRNSINGRAHYLLHSYIRADKKYNRSDCTLTAQWIVENILSKSCVYCGNTDWHKLGCDRKDNSLSHTQDNCVPCCEKCNKEKGKKNYDEYINWLQVKMSNLKLT